MTEKQIPKLKVEKAPFKEASSTKMLNIHSDIFDIIDEISKETNIPKTKITRMLVEFAVKHLEIVECERS
jgi:hypothetical protein